MNLKITKKEKELHSRTQKYQRKYNPLTIIHVKILYSHYEMKMWKQHNFQ